MPDAFDFDLAADLLEQAADEVRRWADEIVDLDRDALVGGLLTDLRDRAVEAAEWAARSLVHRLDDDAAQCRERARLCRVYEAALADFSVADRRWRHDVASLPPGAPIPLRPRHPAAPSFLD